MSVDATKIKVGDKVRLRGGETHIVDHYRWRQDHGTDYPVFVNGIAYTAEGFYSTGLTSIYDIVEIIPAETSEKEPSKDDDWDDSKRSKLMDAIEEWNPGEKPEIHITDIVEHIPNQGENKKVRAVGHQPSHDLIGDKRPNPSQQSAAVEPLRDEMTMRDQFAMAALSALLQGAPQGVSTKAAEENAAKDAYFFADEMMQARKGTNE